MEGVGLSLGVSGVSALAVSKQGEDLVQLVAVSTEDGRLGTYHQSGFAVSSDGHAGTLEQGPEAGEVTGVGVVSLVAVNDQDVQLFTLQDLSAALYSFFILVIRDANSCHFIFPPKNSLHNFIGYSQ